LEIAEDRKRVLDDLVRLTALDVGDEADAAGILLVARIEQAVCSRHVRPEREFDGRIFQRSLRRRSAHSHIEPLCRHRRPHLASVRRTFLVRGTSCDTNLRPSRKGRLCRSPVPRGTACCFPNAADPSRRTRNWDSNAVLICRNLAGSARASAAKSTLLLPFVALPVPGT